MLGYLSKFVLQMLPTISATVIGAFIVATWINPKTPPDPAKIASQAQQAAKAPQTAEPSTQEAAATQSEVEAEAKSADTKPAETKPAEDSKPVKAAKGADTIRIIPIVRQATPATDVAASAPETGPATDERKDAERKDANELARAAIQRLRGGSEPVRAAEEAVKPAAPATVRVQQVRLAPEAPQALPSTPVASAPPLPPAVSISTVRYPQGDAADAAALGQPQRLTPPGEIPTERAPLNLQASNRIGQNPSLADDFLSATKSFFRAITPQ
jgi:hypothetical protein